MRKLIITLACLLIISSLAVCVFAESEDAYVMGVDKTSVVIGDEIEVVIKINNEAKANMYGLMLSFDKDVFEIVDGTVEIDTVDFATFDKDKGTFLFYYNGKSVSHEDVTVGKVTLKVKALNAKKPYEFGDYTITGVASVKNGSEVVAVGGCETVINVHCKEDYSDLTWNDDVHWMACTCCGTPDPSKTAVDHNFKRDEVTCTGCGYEIPEETTPATTAPAPTEPAPTEPADDASGALTNIIILVAVFALFFFILGAVIF